MKVLQVITGLQRAAGTSVFCGEIANQLVANGHECIIVLPYINQEEKYQVDARVKVISKAELKKSKWIPDVVHIHGLWSLWVFHMFCWSKIKGFPIVWSPHGMLTSWSLSQKKWKKIIALLCYQYWGLYFSNLLHATALSEVNDFRRLRLGRNSVIVPLGVNINDPIAKQLNKCTRIALFISRIHPKKGLLNLMDSWAQIRPKGWKIIIAGPSDGNHVDEVLARAKKNEISDVVDYIGPVYGSEKEALYASADIFVLPTYSENFGSVVLEALAQRCPVVITKEAPWAELEMYHCGWWIDVGVPSLTKALQQVFMLTEEERNTMGIRGRKLVEEYYTWDAVGRRMIGAYQTLVTQMNRGVLVNAKK